MKRREFLKGMGLATLWMVVPKGGRAPPRVETERPVEQPEPEIEEQKSRAKVSWCSLSYFHVGCHPGKFSFCDTCGENPRTAQNL